MFYGVLCLTLVLLHSFTINLGGANLSLPQLLQVLHFFIGLGALVSPLIADPFLSDTNCILGAANDTSELWHLRNTLVGSNIHNWSKYHLLRTGMVVTQVSYAFWIMAFINVRATACNVNVSSPPDFGTESSSILSL